MLPNTLAPFCIRQTRKDVKQRLVDLAGLLAGRRGASGTASTAHTTVEEYVSQMK
jgi:hypothetical protein